MIHTELLHIYSDEYILEQQGNHGLNEIYTWLIVNKLSLNVVKTKYMIVATQYKIKHLAHQLQIHVDHKSLQRASSDMNILVFYGIAPDHVINIFKNTNDICSCNLRHSGNNVLIPRPCTEATKRSFLCKTVKLTFSL